MDITKAASILRPGTAWNYDGKELKQAEDGTERVDVPSSDELETLIQSDEYVEKRTSEYPPISDFVDAYVKKEAGDSTQMDVYVQTCLAVKNKYPKPVSIQLESVRKEG